MREAQSNVNLLIYANTGVFLKPSMSSQNKMSPQELRASISLAGVFGLRMLGLFIILPVFALYAVQLGGTQSHLLVGIALGAFGITQAILQIPFGWLSDRYGRKPVIYFGLLLFAIGSFIAAFADNIYVVILGRLIQGGGAISAVVQALAADLTRSEHRTKAMAIIGATIGLSFALSIILGPVLNQWIGVPGIFAATGVLALLAIAIVAMVVPNERIADDLKLLHGLLPGNVDIADRTQNDSRWIVVSSAAESPSTYHLYERNKGTVSELFSTRPELKFYRLAPMHGRVVPARDGLGLVSYVTLPEGQPIAPKSPLPMVLLVHGGPWARDAYGYNSHHQWLANRGYAVLSVNFRGSVGFGKAFVNAGDLQWGRKMHDDLLDAVEWAVEQGIADRRRVAIMGGSYGGYATLAGLAFTPDVFCCGVDIVGPSNLETLLATVPPYWAAFFENLARRVGDPRTGDGRALLRERSPLHAADRIIKPLLIGQGANDPRVKQAEADQIIEAMRAKSLPVTYVLYPQEGHGFAVPENSLSFNAIAETFLAAHLGGRSEPFGDDFRGAEFTVRIGAAHVPGLDEALARRS